MASTVNRLSRRHFLRGVGAGLGVAALSSPLRSARAGAFVPGRSAVGDFDADVATRWFDLALLLIQETPGFTPPVAARALGCAGVALYEAVVGGMPAHRSLAGQLNGLRSLPSVGRNAAYHWPSVANHAMADVLRELFSRAPAAHGRRLAALEHGLATQLSGDVPPGVQRRSRDRGREVAEAILDWARGDGGHDGDTNNFPADYTPPSGPGLWESTPPSFQPALQPYWGANRPMALPFAGLGSPGPPTPFSAHPASACFAEALEVYETVNRLDDERLTIARFWSDDPGTTSTPSGHFVSILTQVITARRSSLAVAAEAYSKLGIAVADAFIACWAVKYQYSLLRPITYIRAHIDPHWGDPLPVATPPFPEYTSGHSVQSGAAAAVLADMFGEVAFTDHTHDSRGLDSRTFPSFAAAAAEAAISRLYGGIHFRPAIEKGLVQGRIVGERVNALSFETST